MAEKIEKSNIQAILELNMLQKGMLYHYAKDNENNTDNIQLSFEINGDLDIEIWQESFHIIQSKNDVLRSVFRWQGLSKPIQIILKECPLDFFYHDFSELTNQATAIKIQELTKSDQNDRFDLAKLPLRVRVMKSDKGLYVMNITNHHILYDGWSTGIMLKELVQCYNQLRSNQNPQFENKPAYKQIRQSRKKITEPEKASAFWTDYLEGYQIAPVFSASESEAIVSEPVQRTSATFSHAEIEAFAAERKVTKASVIYAAYGVLLQKYVNGQDLVFGTVVSDRNSAIRGMDNVIGNFINTVPLRLNGIEESSLSEVVASVNKELIERSQFCTTSYFEIKELLGLTPLDNLFDSAVVIENYPLDEELINSSAEFDISLRSAYENTGITLVISVLFSEELTIELAYKASVISPDHADSIARHFIIVLNEILNHSDKKVKSIGLLSEDEKQQFLYDFNDTKADYPRDETVISLFEKQAEKTPEEVALEYGVGSLNYKELSQKANQIASYLTSTIGVQKGDLVGIMLEREANLLPSILGVLKSGGAYVPIDPDYPAERVNAIVQDSKLKALITRSEYCKETLSELTLVVDLDQTSEVIETQETRNSGPKINASELAYIIYTSGSTGRPKGVMIAHNSLTNYICWAAKKYVKGAKSTFPLYTSISFDLTVTSIFTPLITGNKIVLYEEDKKDVIIKKVITNSQLDVIKLTPSHLKVIRDIELPEPGREGHVKRLIVGGEELESQIAREIHDKFGGHVEIYNEYGPTEATVGCMIHRYEADENTSSVPIGHPADNTQIYLLDKSLNPLPYNVNGELYISGDGLALGYLGNKALTAQSFVNNPFGKGKKMYKTGDYACRLPNGRLVFKGRIDEQVKIRGFRIELNEIEHHLSANEQVSDCVVLARNVGEDHSLVAYYVSEIELSSEELRTFLSERLPGYMVPSWFVKLDQMPLTTNGKLDRKSLPEPQMLITNDFVNASNKTEEALVEIWKKVLGHEQISTNDNFFEIGGDSMKLIKTTSLIAKTLEDKIQINDLFEYPTIRALAKFISSKTENTTDDQPTELPEPFKEAKTESGEYADSDIAIIGMAGRFPGAANVNELWENLKSGTDSISREIEEGKEDPVIKAKGILEGSDLFEASFFNYTPEEARLMDPQMRIFHECTWASLEDAGYNPFEYTGAIGLYAGSSQNPYYTPRLGQNNQDDWMDQWQTHIYSGQDYFCPRVSYKLNLRGPSVNIVTACSTSLVAIDTACRDLLSGKCDMAISGGVSLTFHDNEGYKYKQDMILSPDGFCRAFDKNAAGTVGGNGVGTVVLKKVKDALRDGDNIHAIIKGSATNNDGLQKAGFTAPSITGQAQVIKMAIENANIPAETITYVEAHGTGTLLGDPIEIEGLKRAFNSEKQHFCAIGSVKTNLGHLNAAAGVTGLIKTVMSLKHQQVPPSLHFESAGDALGLEQSPFYVNDQLQNWKRNGVPRRAGVSSFGIGGTNAHVILEEAPRKKERVKGRNYQKIVLSAKTRAALDRNMANLKSYLEAHPNENLEDIAYTLNLGRASFDYRKFLVCENHQDAIEQLTSRARANTSGPVRQHREQTTVFMFSGQGSQYQNMFHDLYQGEADFRSEVDRCFEMVKDISGKDLKAIVFTEKGSTGEVDINNTEFTQPLLFIMEYALASLLIKWGIRPDVMIGHSIGEYAAACISGVFSLEDALRLVVKRGELMQKLPGGAMLSIAIAEKELKPYINNQSNLSLAAVNSSGACVVSGNDSAIDEFHKLMVEEGYKSKAVFCSHAFHSYMMDEILGEFEKVVSAIKIHPQRIPFISNLSGKPASDDEISDAAYWVRHLRGTVRFSDGIKSVMANKKAVFIEVGPGNILSSLVHSNQYKETGHKAVNLVRHPKEVKNDSQYFLSALGNLYLNGLELDWQVFYGHEERQRVSLPTYSFEKIKHPVNPFISNSQPAPREDELVRINEVSEWFYIPTWKMLPHGANETVVNKATSTIVFADDMGLSQGLIKKLEQNEEQVIWVKKGEAFKEVGRGEYQINPASEQDLNMLFESLDSYGLMPDRIIHAWSVGPKSDAPFSMENCLSSCDIYLHSLGYIAKATHKYGSVSERQIILLTNDLQPVLGDEGIDAVKSIPLSLLKVISQEYPIVSTSHIDIALSEVTNDSLIGSLYEEINNIQTGEVVAFRNLRRWVQVFEKVKSQGAEHGKSPAIRNQGVYLITGGLGNLGYSLSKYLLKTHQAKVVLTGRSQLPERDKWGTSLIQTDLADSTREKIEKILRLEKEEGEVLYLPEEVSDLSAMQKLIAEVEERFGPLNGVIHAAGITEEQSKRTIKLMTPEDVAQQLLPKVGGIHVLEEALRDKDLDFCILTSSISTILGGLGFAPYASANVYMDYFVQAHKHTSLRNWISVNFDGLNLNYGEGEGINAKEITDVFDRILSLKKLPQIVVSVGDLNLRLDKWVLKKEFFKADTKPDPDLREQENQSFSNDESESAPTLDRVMLGLWQRFFGNNEMDIDDSFFAIGGDSLKAVQMISRMQKELGVELSIEDLFANPTIRELTEVLGLDESGSETVATGAKVEGASVEEKLLTLWKNFFGHQEIDIDDSFFAIGGDSLKALQMISRIQKEFDIELSVEDLFAYPAIRTLLPLLDNTQEHIEELAITDIPRAPQKDFYPLSAAQRRLHFLNELDKNSLAYNMPLFTTLKGEVDAEKLRSTFNQLAARHESLRTYFDSTDGGAVQKISEQVDFHIERFEAENSEVESVIDQFIRPFNLSQAPLMRLGLIKLAADEHLLMVDVHHLINDAVSKGVLIHDFMTLYEGQALPPLKLQYKDFAQWQQGEAYQGKVAQQKAFWIDEFSGDIPTLELPTDFARPSVKDYDGSAVKFRLNPEETGKLKDIAKTEGATLFMVVLSAYYVLLHKLSNQEDIVISTPVAGREFPDLEKVIGMFVNTIALRNYPRGEASFREFLTEVRTKTLACFDHQAYPFEELVDELQVERDPSRNPLYDVVFAYQNVDDSSLELPGLKISPYEADRATAKFDLELIVVETNGQLELTLEYATRLFKESTAMRFVAYFQRLVSAIIADSEQAISVIDLLTEAEKDEILREATHKSLLRQEDKTFIDLFKAQVQQNPGNTALTCNDGSLTYAELDIRTNQLAALLQERGLEGNAIVGLYMERSVEMVIGLLSILKAGGAYVPIDTEYPEERIKYMIENSGMAMLLTTNELKPVLPTTLKVVCVEEETGASQTEPFTYSGAPSDLCYIIYTSGSTGKPKGVMIEHKSLVNYSSWAARLYSQGDPLAFPLYSSASFDLTVTSIFTPLMSGGEIVIYQGDDQASLIERVFKSNQVDIIKLTPSHLKLLRDAELSGEGTSRLKKLIVGGEELDSALARDIYEKLQGRVAIYNEYGPTEATVGCMIYEFTPADEFNTVPIGTAIDHTHIHILDKYQQLTATGIEGEIYVSGVGVARGYLSNQSLTKERFSDDPFIPGVKMYKTGDLGRRLADGTILFGGRKDEQVKLHGYRIEPGEVKYQLASHDLIKEAVVLVKTLGEEEEKSLVAYYLAESEVDRVELRAFLTDRIPEYMVPAHYVFLEQWPLSTNGKLDEKQLPNPSLKAGDEYVAPGNQTEQILQDVWTEVLGVEGIGVTDNFFSVGGDSIKLILIGSRMRKAGYEVSVQDIFSHPTIRKLANNLRTIATESEQSVVEGKADPSPIQHWLLEGAVKDKHHFNQSVILKFPGGISIEEVEKIFKQLQTHHDALRTTFTQENGRWQQVGQGTDYPVSIVEKDLRQVKNSTKSIKKAADRIQAGIDLQQGPLMKLGLFHTKGGSHLLIVIHHLVTDGVSWRILIEDLETLYQQLNKKEAFSLPLKTDAFLSWSTRLHEYSQTTDFQKANQFWDDCNFETSVPLKRDYPLAEGKIADKVEVSLLLGKKQTKLLLTKVHRAFHTQINDILLVALWQAIRKQYGHHAMVIDLEGHGREKIHADINVGRTIGWFTSIYPVLLTSDAEALSGIIKELKESLRKIPNNGFDYLLYQQEKDAKTQPDSQIVFNYLGQFDTDIEGKSFELSEEPQGATRSGNDLLEYDWDISGMVRQGQLEMTLSYCTAQYNKQTVSSFMQSYEESLLEIIDYCISQVGTQLTPSDFTYQKLSIAQVDELQQQYDIQDIYALSPMQEGMLYHSILEPDVSNYMGQTTCLVKGELDIKAIEKAMNHLMNRYDVLRTLFLHEGYEPSVQVVLKERQLSFQYEDLREVLPNQGGAEVIRSRQARERSRVFDLSRDVLMRLVVLRTGEQEYEFIWSHHHILMDGWCMAIIVREFEEIYTRLVLGSQLSLPEVSPYSGYVKWLESKDEVISEAYWRNYLQGYDSLASLPQKVALSDKPTPYLLASHELIIDKEQTQLLEEASRNHKVTLNTLFQVAWALLLAKYNNTQDVLFGAVVSGRPSEIEGIESMVGLFINTIPVRVKMEGEQSVRDVLQQIQNQALKSDPHHYHPLSEIQSLSELGQQLFDHFIAFENFPRGREDSDAQKAAKPFEISDQAYQVQTHYDLSLTVSPTDEIEICLNYNANKYEADMIARVATHLKQLLISIGSTPDVPIASLTLFSEAELGSMKEEFGKDMEAGVGQATIQHMIQQSFEKHAQNPALEYKGEVFSYEALNVKADKIAHLLNAGGFEEGARIGILCEDRECIISAILGVLKARMIFVPLEVTLPQVRLNSMIEQASTLCIITDQHGALIDDLQIRNDLTWLTADQIDQQAETQFKASTQYELNDAIYVYFTSGTTGVPKGVLGINKSFSHFVNWEINKFKVDPSFRVSQLANPGFDAFLKDVFVPLCAGGIICIPEDEIKSSGREMAHWVDAQNISLFHCVPSFFKLIQQGDTSAYQFENLKYIALAGEKILPYELEKWYQTHGDKIQLVNLYGPTETTLLKGSYFILPEDIQRSYIQVHPMEGAQFLILDKQLNLCPPGATGEIYIRTPYRTAGYINQDALNHQSFVPNPFTGHKDDLIYKTGDLGREGVHGGIEVLGRTDHQVKIRGIRIELDEIQETLIRFEEIADAAVITREDDEGEPLICAYLISSEALDHEKLRKDLSELLPNSMVPAHLISIPEIPLTPNGKLSRKELPEPGTMAGARHVAPANEIEQRLAEIWSDVLKTDLDAISTEKSFFQMGGHSLKLQQLMNRINKHYGVKIPLQQFFDKQNIQKMADYLIVITTIELEQPEEGETIEIRL